MTETRPDSDHRLKPEDLAWVCPPDWLPFASTGSVEPGELAYEQPRAVEALRLASRLRRHGYNVFVAGQPGTGRTSIVRRILRQEAEAGPPSDDLCYVHNFGDPRAPQPLRLPAGTGRRLASAMSEAIERYQSGLAALRASEAHRRRRQAAVRHLEERQARLVKAFEEEVEQDAFALVEVDLGAFRRHELAPVVEGEPVSMDELDDLVERGKIAAADVERFRNRLPVLAARLSETTATLRALGRDVEQARAAADRAAARPIVEEALENVREAVGIARGAHTALDDYLDRVGEFLIELFPALYAAEGRRTDEGNEEAELPELASLAVVEVNVAVDRTGERARPIVEETDPTPRRLFGFVEPQRNPDGTLRAGVGSVHAGALHRADGGFLILHAQDLLAEEGSWPALRRTMRTGQVSPFLGNPNEGPPPLVPDPAPVDVTVVLIGTRHVRDTLAQGDDEFSRLFRLTAIFEERVPLTRAITDAYVRFLAKVQREEQLLPFTAPAVARILEQMVRLAGNRRRLSTRLREFLDLAREASCFCAGRGGGEVERADVDAALASRQGREGVLADRILDSIEQGVLQVETQGVAVGQVNGLAVVDTGLETMGYPARITATTAVGRDGIIDIEREAELSGEIHIKASLILAGFLRSRFAQEQPLAMTASVGFEQSYTGIEGDSASSAELAAILSSLSGIAVRQDLAVTGAVDQHGRILAVGGVNEKVEGFWRTCRRLGTTGTQGVVIPASSVDALQLEPELVDDVRRGRFHLYAVASVEELMDLMTGVPFGRRHGRGRWTPGSLGDRVAARLREMAATLRSRGDRLDASALPG